MIKTLNSLSQLTSESIAYTPVFSASTTNPTIGNGTLVGEYKVISKDTIHLAITMLWGSTSTGGSGEWRFGLPQGLTGLFAKQPIAGVVLDNGTDWKLIVAVLDYGSPNIFAVAEATSTVSSNVPMVWAVGDSISFGGLIKVNGLVC